MKSKRVTDEMFMACARVIAEAAPDQSQPGAPLLPPLTDIRPLSREIALAVGRVAAEQGLAACKSAKEVEALIDKAIWTPTY